MDINGEDDREYLIKDNKKQKKKKGGAGKAVAFVIIGGLTLLYCIAELAAALWLSSLTLLSDGFHNLSDVVSLYIAYWAQNAAQRDLSKEMSYGWILGGLTNGCFLLSLCLYVALEAIPRLIQPETSAQLADSNGGYLFIGVAGVGLILNTVGTIVFAAVGIEHGHSHSHGHGHGHGHGHSHGAKDVAAKESSLSDDGHSMAHFPSPKLESNAMSPVLENDDHGHSHEHKDKKKKKKEHAHGHGEIEHKHKDKEHSHGHGEKEHSHGHGEKEHKHKDKDHKHKHDKEHKHGEKEHKHKDKEHKHKHDDHDHDHDHDHDDHDEKGHSHKKKGGLASMDVNTKAVFLHFLGDAISSLCVLATGIVLHFFRTHEYVKYLDPVSSVLIVGIILFTTVPLVKKCSMILLQSVPSEVDLDAVTAKTSRVDGVISVHDLHVWQLVDGMIIASVHLMITEGTDVGFIVYQVKQIFHSFGIHSSAIQPEFVKSLTPETFCVQNCVEECEADWCCKKTADKKKDLIEEYSTFNDV